MKNLNEYPLWTALITPYTASGSVDFHNLETLLNRQNTAKNGVVLMGSTGESSALTLEERKQIVDFALKQKLDIPLMVGIGGMDLPAQITWVEWLNERQIDAYMAVTPIYAKPSRHGQTQWFKSLLDVSNTPCVLYNVPSRAGVSLNLETVVDLKDHPHFWGVKEASGSVEKFKEYRAALPTKKIFSGDDGLLPDFSKEGADGLISVASNVWPSATHLFTTKCLNQEFDSVTPWPRFAEAMFLAPNPIPAKALLNEIKILTTSSVRPPLAEKDLASRGILMEVHAAVQNWEKENEL